MLFKKERWKAKMRPCAVIGAGNIGCGLNAEAPSHAKSYTHNPSLKLSAVVDVDENRLMAAKKLWNCDGYFNTSDMMTQVKPEIISICVPDAYHDAILTEVLNYSPKAVIVEKPTTQDPQRTKVQIAAYSKAKIPLLVNYSRRYLPIYTWLKDTIREQGVISVIIKYGKGIKHNGCHAVDLARFLFGEIKVYQLLSARIDFEPDDPTVTAHLQNEFCSDIVLQALDQRYFTHFEIDIFTKTNRYIIDNDHQRLRIYCLNGSISLESLKFSDHETISIDHGNALDYLINNVISVIDNHDKPLCSAAEAIKTEEICNILALQGLSYLKNTHEKCL